MMLGQLGVSFGLLTAPSGFGFPFLLASPLLMVYAFHLAPSKRLMATVGAVLLILLLGGLALLLYLNDPESWT